MELGPRLKTMAKEQSSNAAFPNQPEWFQDARGFDNIEKGLKKVGFNNDELYGILR